MNHDFALGDLVWAKLKGFNFWPARVHAPPPTSTPKKQQQRYVCFFGTKQFAWIPLKNITAHSAEMVATARQKKMTPSLNSAVDEIEEAVNARAAGAVQEEDHHHSIVQEPIVDESCVAVDESNKVPVSPLPAKTRKLPLVSPDVKKRTKKAKRPLPYPSVRMTASPSKTNEFQDLYENLTNSIGTTTRVAVIKPFDDRSASTSQAAGGNIAKRDYFLLPPPLPLELKTLSDAFASKEINPTSKIIGWLGLGTMGQRIVKNLLLTSHKVWIWNRSPEKCEPFVEIGAVIADTPADLVLNADIIFSCLSDSDAVKQLAFESFGFLKGLDKSRGQQQQAKAYVELSVIDPDTSIKMADEVMQKGGRYLEAPINGSKKLAEDGQLLVIASGSEEVFKDCESCFNAMAKNSVFVGTQYGTASKMNLATNAMLGVTYAAFAQTMALVENVGLFPEHVMEYIQMSPLRNSSVNEMALAMKNKEFLPNISLKYLQQNLFMTQRMAARCKQPMAVMGAANNLFKHAKQLRYSDHDAAAVYFGAKY